MNCEFCNERDCILERGGIKCLKCQALYCSCSARQMVGVIDTKLQRHNDIEDMNCDGELTVVMRKNWCRCAPLVE